jgi:hypothetical protein
VAEDIEKIQQITRQYSLLTLREETDLVSLLHQSHGEHVRRLRRLFEQDSRWVERFYDVYRAKKQAIVNRDKSAWDKIIAEEVEEFEGFGIND